MCTSVRESKNCPCMYLQWCWMRCLHSLWLWITHYSTSSIFALLRKCGHPKSSNWLLVHIELTAKGGNRRVHAACDVHWLCTFTDTIAAFCVYFFPWNGAQPLGCGNYTCRRKSPSRGAQKGFAGGKWPGKWMIEVTFWRAVEWHMWGMNWYARWLRASSSSVDKLCSPHCIHFFLISSGYGLERQSIIRFIPFGEISLIKNDIQIFSFKCTSLFFYSAHQKREPITIIFISKQLSTFFIFFHAMRHGNIFATS